VRCAHARPPRGSAHTAAAATCATRTRKPRDCGPQFEKRPAGRSPWPNSELSKSVPTDRAVRGFATRAQAHANRIEGLHLAVGTL